jgi:hypothetical protein
MQKVIVFGDSYAVNGNSEQSTWVDMLANDFDVTVYSQVGCGPDLQLKKFIEHFESNQNDVIVFVLPHHLRLALQGLEAKDQVYSFLYLHDKVKGISKRISDRLKSITQSKKNVNYETYKNRYATFLDLWYKLFLTENTYLETEPFKIASAISKYRKLSKKIILIPVHPFTVKQKDLLQEDNFVVSDLVLRELDEEDDVKIINGIDTRVGHLNYDNHCKVYNYLKEQIND